MIERRVPPGSTADQLTSSYLPTPVDDDRSFFIPETPRFIRSGIAKHPYDYQIPDLIDTPIDELTGLPWCFAPNPNIPPVPRPNQVNMYRRGEWNHMFPRVEVLYSDNPVLDDWSARMALLNLRWQWVGYDDHHLGYNPNFAGPLQPATHKQLGATAIMGLGGYIPETAIGFRNNKPIFQRLTSGERRHLWNSGQVRTGSETEVLHYLFKYVFSQAVDHIKESVIDEFLHTGDVEKRTYLGHSLAAKIIERAVEPAEEAYKAARQKGLLQVVDPATGRLKAPPKHPAQLVQHKIIYGQRRYGRAYNELTRILGKRNRELSAA